MRFWLAVVWLIYTTAMVLWWWRLGLTATSEPSKYRMLMGEGASFLLTTTIGGAALIYLVMRDHERHGQLKNFFNIFSHDLKTSISRLRLQADVLKEEGVGRNNKTLERMLDDINRLDLQLENSLIFSEGNSNQLVVEDLSLSNLVEMVKNECLELEVSLDQDARIRADRRSLMSVLRNLFQNAMIHGNSQRISIRSEQLPLGRMRLSIYDHGKGFSGNFETLGHDPLPQQESTGNGIGLYLCRSLISRQGGKLEFSNDATRGFAAHLELPGEALKSEARR
jgi:signal transduction histidine kinase